MGELKNRGRTEIGEIQNNFQEIRQSGEQSLAEKTENVQVFRSVEGVDDDDKSAIEDGKNNIQEIAAQIAESTMETPKNAVNERADGTIAEMEEYAGREQTEATAISAMNGNYGAVGSSLEQQFTQSATEFSDIASSGKEIKQSSNEAIDAIIQGMNADF